MSQAQLRLVHDAPLPTHTTLGAAADPVCRVFAHWLFVMDKSAARCKLDVVRRRGISAALALFDVDVLLLAVEGMAADPWCAEKPYLDIEWMCRMASRIERFADVGETARRRMQVEEAQRADLARRPTQQPPAGAEPVADTAQLERFRQLLKTMRTEGRTHG